MRERERERGKVEKRERERYQDRQGWDIEKERKKER